LRTKLLAIATALLLTAFAPAAASAAVTPPAITVYAAASLTNVLSALGDEYTKRTGVPVKFSFAASSLLARQIEAGAAADVFFSADTEWMDYLDQRNRLRRDTRRNVLGNRLALVAPADSRIELQIEPGFALVAALGNGRLATGDPDSVPVGRYARGALTSLGVWNDVVDRLVRAEDVRSALAFVARGEAPLGIVYETDARTDRRIRVVALFPESSHLPITYPVALTAGAHAEAGPFVDFLRSDVGRAAFERFGFKVLK
jgi:molybdate transport system substrate-binding protein